MNWTWQKSWASSILYNNTTKHQCECYDGPSCVGLMSSVIMLMSNYRWLKQYSDWLWAGWQGFISWEGLSVTISRPFGGPLHPPAQRVLGVFPWIWSNQSVKLTTYLHLVPGWNMHGTVPSLPYTFSWYGSTLSGWLPCIYIWHYVFHSQMTYWKDSYCSQFDLLLFMLKFVDVFLCWLTYLCFIHSTCKLLNIIWVYCDFLNWG
jgi:hypothetical protein